MSIWDEIASDGDEILSDLGRQITFRDKKMLALIDTNPVSEEYGNGGFVYKAGYKVRMLIKNGTELHKNLPKQGESMEVYGRDYTITRITQRTPSPWVDAFVIASNQ